MQLEVTSAELGEEIIRRGFDKRKVGSTKSNAFSSRSHAIVVFGLATLVNHTVTNRQTLTLCDLAGSERVKKSGVSGEQLAEAQNINLSLSILCNCIRQLADDDKNVSWRDSKLTRLLKASFTSPRVRVALLVCVSPHPKDALETMSSISFGQNALRAKVRARGEKGMVAAQASLISELQQELKHAKDEMHIMNQEAKRLLEDNRYMQTQSLVLKEDNSKLKSECEKMNSHI